MSVGAPPGDSLRLFERLNRHCGDTPARDELVARFLPLARKLAYRYQGSGEPLDDLVQVASLGLVKAIDRFDTSRGVSFTTYAVPTIMGELKRHFRDNRWAVHVPRGTRDRALRVHAAIRAEREATGRRPASLEMARKLELPQEQVEEALGALRGFDAISLDTPIAAGEDEAQPRSETIGAIDDDYERTEDRVALDAALRKIPSRDRSVLVMRFVEDRTQSDIAARIGVSQMQVSRILRRALNHLQLTMGRPVPAS